MLYQKKDYFSPIPSATQKKTFLAHQLFKKNIWFPQASLQHKKKFGRDRSLMSH